MKKHFLMLASWSMIMLGTASFVSCDDDDDDNNDTKKENVNNGGNDQNQNGGNDQNQNGGNDQNQNGGNDQNQNGGNDQNQNGGNDQNQNEQKGIVGTWVLNTKESVTKQDGKIDELDDMLGSNISFNADGTINGDDGMTGKYSLNGKDLTIEYTEDGETVTLKKGERSMDEEDLAEIKEGFEMMGIPASGIEVILNAFVINVEDFSATVNGDKLTINYAMVMKLDKNKLADYASWVPDEMIEMYSSTVESKMVFDRK